MDRDGRKRGDAVKGEGREHLRVKGVEWELGTASLAVAAVRLAMHGICWGTLDHRLVAMIAAGQRTTWCGDTLASMWVAGFHRVLSPQKMGWSGKHSLTDRQAIHLLPLWHR